LFQFIFPFLITAKRIAILSKSISMKKNLLFIFIFATSILFAQKNKGNNFHWVSEQWGVAAVGGQFHPDMTKFNTELTAWGAKSVFYDGLRGYGITFAEPLALARNGNFDASYSFEVMMKRRVTIGAGDSLTFDMKGWDLMSSLFGKDVIPGDVVALVLAPGIDWGTMKMIRTVKGNGALYKNGYIAPFARAEFRLVFGPVVVGARGIYRYDITKDSWKLKSGPAFPLPGTKNTGMSIEFFVGWGHVHFQ
jgi:hypothetical protein